MRLQSKFFWLLMVMAIASASWGFSSSVAQAKEDPGFISEKLIHFGMKVKDLDKLVEDEDDWEIAYKIQTKSTTDIACRYKKKIYFQARFYQDRCYFLEKRSEAPLDEVKEVFAHYIKKYGESPEGTQSRDGRLYFARWDKDDREISLTADMRSTGEYILTYEDIEPGIIGEANYIQEQEIRNSQSGTDPITGAPR